MNEQQVKAILKFLQSRPLSGPDARGQWYDRSYSVFIAPIHDEKPCDAVVRAMAYAASWVQLIRAARPPENSQVVARLIAALDAISHPLRQYSESEYRAAVLAAREAFGVRENGESIVLLSKAMHFFRPTIAPMIDTNVGKAWAALRQAHGFLQPETLLSGTIGHGKKKRSVPNETDYLRYWPVAKRFAEVGKQTDPGFDFRALDRLLFNYGKDMAMRRRKSSKGLSHA